MIPSKTYVSIVGIEAHGTLYVIYLAYLKGLIAKTEAKNILDSIFLTAFTSPQSFTQSFLTY